MNKADIIKERDAFCHKVSDLCTAIENIDSLSEEDVKVIYDRFKKELIQTENIEQIHVTNNLPIISPVKTTINDYQVLKGYYLGYCYWDIPEKHLGEISINIIEIFEINIEKQLLRCRLCNCINPINDMYKIKWDYEGYVVFLKNNIMFFLECLPANRQYYPEIVTLFIKEPSFWPDEEDFFLYGIFSALSGKANPCSAKTILQKIDKDKISYPVKRMTKDEMLKNVKNGKNIFQWINNNVESYKCLIALQPDFLEFY